MGKIVGHCTVGWQVNEAQMAGPKARRGGARRKGTAYMAAARHITATAASASVDDYETLTHLSSYSLPSAAVAAVWRAHRRWFFHLTL